MSRALAVRKNKTTIEDVLLEFSPTANIRVSVKDGNLWLDDYSSGFTIYFNNKRRVQGVNVYNNRGNWAEVIEKLGNIGVTLLDE